MVAASTGPRSPRSLETCKLNGVDPQAYLADVASGDYLTLDAQSHRDRIDQLAGQGIAGGATYDALVGSTAKITGAVLLTRDVRAIPTYERLEVPFELVT